MKATRIGLISAIFVFGTSTLWAASSSVQLPERFLIGMEPGQDSSPNKDSASEPELEKPQAVLGTSAKVITPIFAGENGNASYIRFVNANNSGTQTTVKIVGSRSGTLYGTAIATSPAYSSPQFSYSEILDAAGVTGLMGEDDGYSFYLENEDLNTGFQHVIYNNSNTFFENMSACTWSSADYSPMSRALVNVHTTLLNGYPSTVFIHNYYNQDQDYEVSVYESRNGTFMGTLTLETVANGSYAIPMSWFEEQLNWSPTDNELHANLFFSPASGDDFYAVLSQSIYNEGLAAYINMTQICDVNDGEPDPVVVTETVQTHLESTISGSISSYNNGTQFTLLNGQVWEQTSFDIGFVFLFSPSVVIFQSGVTYKMAIEGIDDWLTVKRIQ